jgi:hypothetical protein
MPNLITVEYQSLAVSFTDDGWFNATDVAAKFGKRPVDWLRLDSTKEYINALRETFSEVRNFHITRKGNSKRFAQGTWLHPKLAVAFARWLDVRFAVWCDAQIDAILRGTHPQLDWKRARHEAIGSNKIMNAVLQMQRQLQGKTSAAHHYSNEARLINWALSGTFTSLDRATLALGDLDLLAKLEERNAVMIGFGLAYPERKSALETFAAEWRKLHATQSQQLH